MATNPQLEKEKDTLVKMYNKRPSKLIDYLESGKHSDSELLYIFGSGLPTLLKNVFLEHCFIADNDYSLAQRNYFIERENRITTRMNSFGEDLGHDL